MGLLKLLQPTLAARPDLEAAAFVFVQSMIWLGRHAHYIMPCIFVLWLAYCVVEKRRLTVSPKPKQMKTKTTLAALLLAAVMVTPSYGADKNFLVGAEDQLKNIQEGFFSLAFFRGGCQAVCSAGIARFPEGKGIAWGQIFDVVARYVYQHPEHHHLSEVELIKRACKEAWPNENKYVFISK